MPIKQPSTKTASRARTSAKRTYSPNGKTAEILRVALDLINAAPYKVSARWVFYQLLQMGYYASKDDYKDKFSKATSQARHALYNGWRPDTLDDETRVAIDRTGQFNTLSDWVATYAKTVIVDLDVWPQQECYLEIWYEARAMTQQFVYHTRHITLRPMGGQPSIHYKYQTAKHLEQMGERYQLPIVVLYFGDLDTSGGIIADVAERDVRKWCDVDFTFVRCGLTQQQVVDWNVPENFEKPGEYQWEALSDEGAKTIITQSIEPYLRQDALDAAERRMARATSWARRQFVLMAESLAG
jgi:hypothetical protein